MPRRVDGTGRRRAEEGVITSRRIRRGARFSTVRQPDAVLLDQDQADGSSGGAMGRTLTPLNG